MKTIFLTVIGLLVAAQSHAQLSKSSEPRPQKDHHSGEVILMPTTEHRNLPKLAAVTSRVSRPAQVRNRAQARTNSPVLGKNGYHSGNSRKDWGTNVRLNTTWFLPTLTGF